MMVAYKGGGGFCVISTVHQEYQLLGGGIQLFGGLCSKLNAILRDIAASDDFHSALTRPIDWRLYAAQIPESPPLLPRGYSLFRSLGTVWQGQSGKTESGSYHTHISLFFCLTFVPIQFSTERGFFQFKTRRRPAR